MEALSVLVIEDETNIRESIQEILEAHDYVVYTARTGAQGLKVALDKNPSIILCDIMMPVMNGHELVKKLRQIDLFAFTPFIFLTAKSSMNDLREGMELGADDYLTKPFTIEGLIRCVTAAAKRVKPQMKKVESINGELMQSFNRLKTISFLNSHRIRAHLCHILGVVELVKSDDRESLDRFLPIIEEAAKNIDEVIHEVNEIARQTSKSFGPIQRKSRINSIWLLDSDDRINLINKLMIEKFYPEISLRVFLKSQECLKELEIQRPDLLFLDLNMPDMNGMDFLEAQKELGRHTEVVVLSSSIDPDEINKVHTFSQVIKYVPKPLTKNRLMEIVEGTAKKSISS